MRIALMTGRFYELSQTFVLDHARMLCAMGHEVIVLSRDFPASAGNHHALERGARMEVRTLAVRGGGLRRAAVRAGQALGAGLAHPWMGVRALLGGGVRTLSTLGSAALRDLRDVDILHCHFGPHGAFGDELLRARRFARAHVTTFHGFDAVGDPAVLGPMYRKLFAGRGIMAVNSEFIAGKIRKLGCTAERIRIVRCAVDTARFAFRERRWPVDGVPAFVSVGRLTPKKGHDVAIEAMAMVKARFGAGFRHHIVGGADGNALEQYRELAERLGVAEQVMLHGPLPHQRVREVLEEAQVFVLASRRAPSGDMEGTPVVLGEAQACGMPIVSTRHGGIPEVVDEGKSALLVREGDPGALAGALLEMLDRREEWADMGRAGRALVERELASEKVAGVLARVYEESLAQA